MNYPEAFGFGSIFHRALLPLNSSWILLAALKSGQIKLERET
jgi:hypothetical protein